MEQNFPFIPIFRNIGTSARGTPKIPKWDSGKCPFHSLFTRNFRKFWSNGKRPKSCFCFYTNGKQHGGVEKTDPRSADYPLIPAPRTTQRTTPRTTLWTTATEYPKQSTKFLSRGREIHEAYLLHLHDHNCLKNSRNSLFPTFSTHLRVKISNKNFEWRFDDSFIIFMFVKIKKSDSCEFFKY